MLDILQVGVLLEVIFTVSPNTRHIAPFWNATVLQYMVISAMLNKLTS